MVVFGLLWSVCEWLWLSLVCYGLFVSVVVIETTTTTTATMTRRVTTTVVVSFWSRSWLTNGTILVKVLANQRYHFGQGLG